MPKSLFYKSLFTIKYILRNKIIATILADTCTIRYSFIDEKFAEKVCLVLEIKPQYLIKLKQIQEFDNRVAKLITHTIYLILIIGIYTESLAFLPITKLENHLLIFG